MSIEQRIVQDVQQAKWWLVDFPVSDVKLSRFLVCRLLSSRNYPSLSTVFISLALIGLVSRWIISVVDRFPDCVNFFT